MGLLQIQTNHVFRKLQQGSEVNSFNEYEDEINCDGER